MDNSKTSNTQSDITGTLRVTQEHRIAVVGFIPQEAFSAIYKNAPLSCVDMVIMTPDGVPLGKRLNMPAKGLYFNPGGRIFKGETPSEAVVRIAKAEAGLDVRVKSLCGVYSVFFEKGYADGTDAHYQVYVYAADQIGGSLKGKSNTSDLSEFMLVKNYADAQRLHPQPLVEIIDSGVLDGSNSSGVHERTLSFLREQ